MKKSFLIALVAMAIIFSAGFTLAGDARVDGNGNATGINITDTDTNTNDNNNANDLNQEQEMRQQMEQGQGQNFEYSNVNKRGHIAPYGVSGFVSAPSMMAQEGWQLFACQPMFRTFKVESLEKMKSDGSFFGYKGGIFDALFLGPVKRVIHEEGGQNNSTGIITRLDWAPEGNMYYPEDRVLAEYEVEGKYGVPWGGGLARGLFEAYQDTRTTRVVVWYRVRMDAKNSGMSIGSGAAGAHVFGSSGDASAAAIGLGGLVGTTTAYVERAYDFKIWAMNDGPIEPPPGFSTVCGAVSPKPPVAAEVKPPTPAPCDPEPIRREIAKTEEAIRNCHFWSRANLEHRARAAYLYEKLYICTGKADKALLEKSIFHAGKAQQNYDEVKKPGSSRAVSRANWDEGHALKILGSVYWNQAAAIREMSGREAEVAFAKDMGMEWMPQNIDEIKIP